MKLSLSPNQTRQRRDEKTEASYPNPQGTESENDPNNTTIFVGGLDSNVTDDHLRQVFSQFGELIHVKIPMGKRCGFVKFANRRGFVDAQLGAQNIRLSWGSNPSSKQQDPSVGSVQPQADPNQWNGCNIYGYNQGFPSYGYTPPAQEPNMYDYGPCPGYGNFQQQYQQ